MIDRLKMILSRFLKSEESGGSTGFLVVWVAFALLYTAALYAEGETKAFLESLVDQLVIPFLILCAIMVPVAIWRIRESRNK